MTRRLLTTIIILIIILPVIAQEVTEAPEPTLNPTVTNTVTITPSMITETVTSTPEVTVTTPSASPTLFSEASPEATVPPIQATIEPDLNPESTEETVESTVEAELTEILVEATVEINPEPETTGEAESTIEADTPEITPESTLEVEVSEVIAEATAELTEAVSAPIFTATPTEIELSTIQSHISYQSRDTVDGIQVQAWTLDLNLISVGIVDEQGIFTIQVPLTIAFYLVAYAPLHQRVELIINNALEISPLILAGGDLNADMCIDDADMNLIITNYGREDSPSTDINNDGFTDLSDLAILSGNYSESCVVSVFTNQIPVPESTQEAEITPIPESTVSAEVTLMPESTQEAITTIEAEETLEASDE